MAPMERLKHTLALRWVDDLPDDTYVTRDPAGPRPGSSDPAAQLGVKVVQLA